MKNSINLITIFFVLIIGLLMLFVHLTNNDINRIPKLIGAQKLIISPGFKLYINDNEFKNQSIEKISLIIDDLKELKQQFNYEYNEEKDEYNLTLDYHLFKIKSRLVLKSDHIIITSGSIVTNTLNYCEN